MDTKRARRDARLRAEDLERHREAVSTPRDPRDDIHFAGVGVLLCQFVRMPSFTSAICFDIRRAPGGELRLFVADGTAPGARSVVGYSPVDAQEDVLARCLERLASIALRAVPQTSTFGFADGTRIEVAVDTGLGGLRASWSEDAAPAGWEPLEALAKEMFATFSTWNRRPS